jgi:hypothetical protein
MLLFTPLVDCPGTLLFLLKRKRVPGSGNLFLILKRKDAGTY